jgi:hypothetical protein
MENKDVKIKYRVHVRAIRTRIYVPGKGMQLFKRGYIFEKPWPELVAIAEADKKNRVWRLEEIKEGKK